MIEPDPSRILVGERNFPLNGLSGNFIRAAVGQNGFNLDDFIATEGLPFVDIVHADIQGSELIMLRDMERTLLTKKVGYLFISTHSQLLHEQCRRYLEDREYVTIASADFDHETIIDAMVSVSICGALRARSHSEQLPSERRVPEYTSGDRLLHSGH